MIAPSARHRKGSGPRHDGMMTKLPKTHEIRAIFLVVRRSLTISLSDFTLRPHFGQLRALVTGDNAAS